MSIEMRGAKFTVRINEEVFEYDTQAELAIDRDDLDQEMARQAAHYAWFYVLYERARALRVQSEASADRLDYEIEVAVRDEAARAGAKTTEGSVKAAVRTHPRRVEALEILQGAEYNERMLGAMVSALAQRKDMLISLARARNFEQSTPTSAEVQAIKNNLSGGTR